MNRTFAFWIRWATDWNIIFHMSKLSKWHFPNAFGNDYRMNIAMLTSRQTDTIIYAFENVQMNKKLVSHSQWIFRMFKYKLILSSNQWKKYSSLNMFDINQIQNECRTRKTRKTSKTSFSAHHESVAKKSYWFKFNRFLFEKKICKSRQLIFGTNETNFVIVVLSLFLYLTSNFIISGILHITHLINFKSENLVKVSWTQSGCAEK